MLSYTTIMLLGPLFLTAISLVRVARDNRIVPVFEKTHYLTRCLRQLLFAYTQPFTEAQFGLGKKRKAAAAASISSVGEKENKPVGSIEDDIDLDDPELLEALEMLLDMSPEEMDETMKELLEMMGDDPETVAAIEGVFKDLPDMVEKDIQSSLLQMMLNDKVAEATQDALQLVGASNWDTIWEKQDLILDAVIQTGKMSADDASLYKSDKAAWEKELRFIWNELQVQAKADGTGDEL